MWMSGYGGRTKPAQGKETELWAKALVLEDAKGRKAVLVTLDLVGIGRDISTAVCKRSRRSTAWSGRRSSFPVRTRTAVRWSATTSAPCTSSMPSRNAWSMNTRAFCEPGSSTSSASWRTGSRRC